MMESPFDKMNEAAIPQAVAIKPQEAGNFASYPYPFTRYHPWAGLYSPNYAFYPISPYRMVGKLFFTLGGNNYVCSASVIRPHLVITARHCMYDGSWATNVVFYPGWINGPNWKLKAWKARRLGTWSLAGGGAGLKWDLGFIQTFDDDNVGCNGSSGGKAIEWFTGFLGWMYGGYVGDRNYTSMGYPAAAPFDGKWQVQAHSDVGNIDPLDQPGTFSMGNDMTGGSSGGPWLVGFGTTNWVNGLNSYKWVVPARPLEMNGPNFQTDNFWNLLAWAQGWPCP
jgi:V8-like Glu-specific endopeptidase